MKKIILSLCLTLMLVTYVQGAPGIIYVSTTGNNSDGSSWTNAYTSLQGALTEATSGYQIWVAASTYKPTDGLDRTASFCLIEGVSIYGGFDGTEVPTFDLSTRDFITNETILSGDINGNSVTDPGDSYNIFVTSGAGWVAPAGLDGFTIKSGYADGTGNQSNGAAMVNSGSIAIIENCTFKNNTANAKGGAIYNFNSTIIMNNCTFTDNLDYLHGGALYNEGSSCTINNCTFTSNRAYSRAGVIYNVSSPVTIDNCTFSNNQCINDGGTDGWAGAIMQNAGTLSLTNSVFANNSTLADGGAVYSNGSSPSIINCLFYNNSSQRGSGVWSQGTGQIPLVNNCTFYNNISTGGEGTVAFNGCNGSLTNSILWDATPGEVNKYAGAAPSITYNCIKNGDGTLFPGTGNIFTDPLFVDASSNNFSLQNTSPCIGAGTATGAPSTDILGATRGTPPDMGAYENVLDAPLPVELTSFTGVAGKSGIELMWSTAAEVNNYGFDVERSLVTSQQSLAKWEKVGFVPGAGNSNSPKEYSFIDVNPIQGNAEYRLKQMDLDGNFKYYTNIAKVNFLTAVKEKQIPKEFGLSQNYPNPFNPTTIINYALPVAGMVKIDVYNNLGEKITTLVNEIKNAGNYQVEWKASGLSSGVYFYTIHAKNESSSTEFRMIKKMMLVK